VGACRRCVPVNMEDENKVRKRGQDRIPHIPIHLRHTGVCPKYLGRERVKVGKGVHELSVFMFPEFASEFSTKGFLHGVVAGEFDKGPLCATRNKTLE